MIKLLMSIGVLASLFISCSKTAAPEQVLSEYVKKRFSSKMDVSDFKEYLGGEILKETLAEDGKYLKSINQTESFKLNGFKIDVKRCVDDSKCFITYSISYMAHYEKAEGEKSDAEIKVRKIAEMLLLDKAWKIHGISDVKTNIEYKD